MVAAPQNPHVALLVTCLVDVARPQIAFAAIELLERAGCRVEVPAAQTCCGQPAFNSGAREASRALAGKVIETFAPFDYVVVPSGSCAGMVKVHFAELFAHDPVWCGRAEDLAARTFELTEFLVDVMGLTMVPTLSATAPAEGVALYHDSCSGLRELGIKTQPRALLAGVQGLQTKDYSGSETCCGFGGTFCVKYPEVSDRIVGQRTSELAGAKGDLLVGGDLGCLMNLAGKLSREGSPLRVFHVAEVLTGGTDGPAIGAHSDLASRKTQSALASQKILR